MCVVQDALCSWHHKWIGAVGVDENVSLTQTCHDKAKPRLWRRRYLLSHQVTHLSAGMWLHMQLHIRLSMSLGGMCGYLLVAKRCSIN